MKVKAEWRDNEPSSADALRAETHGALPGSAAIEDLRTQSSAQLQHTEVANAGSRMDQQRAAASVIQRKTAGVAALNRSGLPDKLKAGIESLSGFGMDEVKVHYNSSRPAQLNAHAYAQGTDIHIAPGQERHLPHEAWHVVQQAQGRVRPTISMERAIEVNDDIGLEAEATLMGAKALAQLAEPATLLDNGLGHVSSTVPIQFSSYVTDDEINAALARSEPLKFFHGTDLQTAQKLVQGEKVLPIGKGEFGGGIYLTHNLHQAAHIADYYVGKAKGNSWAVVEFQVDEAALQKLSKKEVPGDEFNEYYEHVKNTIGQEKESEYSWTMGPIKDTETPYAQHLFARDGIELLNSKPLKRNIVMSGKVGIEKALYEQHTKGYNIDEDDELDRLGAIGLPDEEDEVEEEDENREGEEEGAEDQAPDINMIEVMKEIRDDIIAKSSKKYTKSKIDKFYEEYEDYLEGANVLEFLNEVNMLKGKQK